MSSKKLSGIAFFYFKGYRGTVRPPSDDEGIERTNGLENGFLSDQSLCFVLFFLWEGEMFITRSNDNNVKEMCCPLHTLKLKLTTHLDRKG